MLEEPDELHRQMTRLTKFKGVQPMPGLILEAHRRQGLHGVRLVGYLPEAVEVPEPSTLLLTKQPILNHKT